MNHFFSKVLILLILEITFTSIGLSQDVINEIYNSLEECVSSQNIDYRCTERKYQKIIDILSEEQKSIGYENAYYFLGLIQSKLELGKSSNVIELSKEYLNELYVDYGYFSEELVQTKTKLVELLYHYNVDSDITEFPQITKEQLDLILEDLSDFTNQMLGYVLMELENRNQLTVENKIKVYYQGHLIEKENAYQFRLNDSVIIAEEPYFEEIINMIDDNIELYYDDVIPINSLNFLKNSKEYINENNDYKIRNIAKMLIAKGNPQLGQELDQYCETLSKAYDDYSNKFISETLLSIPAKTDSIRELLNNGSKIDHDEYIELVFSKATLSWGNEDYDQVVREMEQLLNEIENFKLGNLQTACQAFQLYCVAYSNSEKKNDHLTISYFLNDIVPIFKQNPTKEEQNDILGSINYYSEVDYEEYNRYFLQSTEEVFNDDDTQFSEEDYNQLYLLLLSYANEGDFDKFKVAFEKAIEITKNIYGEESEEFISILQFSASFRTEENKEYFKNLYKKYGDKILISSALMEDDEDDTEMQFKRLMEVNEYQYFGLDEKIDSIRLLSDLAESEKFLINQVANIAEEEENFSRISLLKIEELDKYSNREIQVFIEKCKEAIANLYPELLKIISIGSSRIYGTEISRIDEKMERLQNICIANISLNNQFIDLLYELTIQKKKLGEFLIDLRKSAIKGTFGNHIQEKVLAIIEQEKEMIEFNFLSMENRIQQGDSIWKRLNLISENNIRLNQEYKNFNLTKIVTWTEIKEVLDENSAAIEIIRYLEADNTGWTSKIRYCAIAISKSSPYPLLINIDLDDLLEKDVLQLYEEAIRGNVVAANTLYDLLLKDIQVKLPGVNNYYLAPAGIFSLINLSTLINQKTNDFILDETKVNLLTRTDILPKVLTNNRFTPTKSTLIGHPAYTSKPEDSNNFQRWKELKGSRKELDTLQFVFAENKIQVTEYSELEADPKLLRNIEDKTLDVLHISTHGFYTPPHILYRAMVNASVDSLDDTTYPTETRFIFKDDLGQSNYDSIFFTALFQDQIDLDTIGGMDLKAMFNEIGGQSYKVNPFYNSGLVMAGANDKWNNDRLNDGIVYSASINLMDLSDIEIVSLSACATFGNHLMPGGLPDGIASSFRLAGVNKVVGTLWKVADEVSQNFFIFFYKNLLSGKYSIQESFYLTQEYIKDKYPNPYLWGSFVLLING